MRRAPGVLALAFLALPALSVPATAQLTPRDSLHILGEAHSAQMRFEASRRTNLPRTSAYATREPVATIGRMTYWPDEGEDQPIAEPRTIARARASLIVTLSRLNQLSRADEWIAGQRVRYLVESGSDSAAIVAARECWAAKWWCGVLLGYALHSSGRYSEAEAAYDSALVAMPAETRCKWRDISLLLDDDERDHYEHMTCDERVAIEQRFWDLAQPSYVVRGNDRRTEHFSRVLVAQLAAGSANPYGLDWGDDLRELIVRYGASSWYTTSWPTNPYETSGPIIGHDRHPSFHFAAAIEGDSARWDMNEKTARERYSPPYVDTVTYLDAQFAMMKRGDSALVVAAYADTLDADNAVLGVANGGGHTATTGGDTTAHLRVRRSKAPWRGLVVGMEKMDPNSHRLARARAWLMPPASGRDTPQLSTLLLFTPDTSKSIDSLDEALASALTANELKGTRKLGLYWEMYGAMPESKPIPGSSKPTASTDSATLAMRTDSAHAAPADTLHVASRDSLTHTDSASAGVGGSLATHAGATPVAAADSLTHNDSAVTVVASADSAAVIKPAHSDVSITVARVDGGILHWLSHALRITPASSPIAVHWHDGATGGDVASRSVVLDLAQFPAGTYRVTLAVGPDDNHLTSTSREIRLR